MSVYLNVYICTLCVMVPVEPKRGIRSPRTGVTWQSGAIMQMLGTEPGSAARAANALTAEPSHLSSPVFQFLRQAGGQWRETRSHVAQNGLRLITELRVALNSWSSCIRYPALGLQPCTTVFTLCRLERIRPKALCVPGTPSTN